MITRNNLIFQYAKEFIEKEIPLNNGYLTLEKYAILECEHKIKLNPIYTFRLSDKKHFFCKECTDGK